jgi:deoxyribose-phosphate aldolase
MKKSELARIIDHTNLKPDAKDDDITHLCEEAIKYGFKAAVVNPVNVRFAARLLHGSGVAVCSVVGFPLGATTRHAKAFEAEEAIRNGASEIDMVANIGALKSGRLDDVKLDIESVAGAVKGKGKLLKVIIEAPVITDDEKVKVCSLAKDIGVDFVKSCTGFAGSARIEDIRLMRTVVGEAVGVKAAGGIRSYSDAVRMIEAGASRIGTSSGPKIIQQASE